MRLLLIILMGISSSLAAVEVKYVTLTPLTFGHRNYRDTWDQTRHFCFRDEIEVTHCYPIAKMGEIQLRDKGQWSTEVDYSYIASLSDESREQASRFDRIFVRYLALAKEPAKFVVHIHYLRAESPERMSQTIFLTGDYFSGGKVPTVRMRSMSFSNGLEELGAVMKASSKLGSRATRLSIYEQIVRDNQALLAIGESVVNAFLNPGTRATPSLANP